MSKIICAGSAIVIKSEFSLAALEAAQKFNPASLTLKDDKGNTYFQVVVSRGNEGSINKYGVVFGEESTGCACITMGYHGVDGDIKEAIAEEFGQALANLNAVEEALPAVIESSEEAKAAIKDSIEVIG